MVDLGAAPEKDGWTMREHSPAKSNREVYDARTASRAHGTDARPAKHVQAGDWGCAWLAVGPKAPGPKPRMKKSNVVDLTDLGIDIFEHFGKLADFGPNAVDLARWRRCLNVFSRI